MEINRLGLIAGKGTYPDLVFDEALRHGVKHIAVAAFEGETCPQLVEMAHSSEWMRVGQLGRLVQFFKKNEIRHAMMAGQITPGRLFDLRPDWQALWLLARMKKRNAETLFGAVADFLQSRDIELIPAVTFLESHLAEDGWWAGPKPSRQFWDDVNFGWPIAKKISAMDVGQTIVVKKGTVLAVEGFDGTNATIRRGGQLGKGLATMIKVSKPKQDMRFDVPVIGPDTLRIAAESGITGIVCESKKTLLLGKDEIKQLAGKHGIMIAGKTERETNE